MARTDIHRPSAPEFDPQAYGLFGYYDLQLPAERVAGYGPDGTPEIAKTPEALLFDAQRPRLEAQGYRLADHVDTEARCGHCGNIVRYAAILFHPETREYMAVGEECMGNRFELTQGEFRAMREASEEQRKATLALERQQQERAERNARVDALVARDERLEVLRDVNTAYGLNSFLGDLSAKLWRWELSDRQIEAALASIDREEARAAERASAEPAPEGRVHITGIVERIKMHVTDWGASEKMTVRDDRGFRVWATVPNGALIGEGDRITFVATLEPSDRDDRFAFGKRPAKIHVIEEV